MDVNPRYPRSGEEQDDPGPEDGQSVEPGGVGDRKISGREKESCEAVHRWLAHLRHWVGQAGERVEPDTHCCENPDDGESCLRDDVEDCSPPHPVAQSRLEPSEESRSRDERFRCFDVLAEKIPGHIPVESPDAPRPLNRQGDDCEAKEGDREECARCHRHAYEGDPDPGERSSHQDEEQL